MAEPAYTPALEAAVDTPLFLGLARAVVRDVRRGRLRPGARLPGSRELAARLGIHRNTVLAAYAELEQEGWIVTRPARGTFVAEALPDVSPRRFAATALRRAAPIELPQLAFDHPVLLPSQALMLVGGLPDVRLMPRVALARAYRRALVRAPDTLSYGSERGDARLVAAVLDLLRVSRGVVAAEDELIVTRGSQMGLFLAASAVVPPGGVVAVEALGYRPAWRALSLAGARLVPVAVDRGGLSVEALDQLAQKERVVAVYVTPHHQYPTTVTMTASRRLELLAVAERRRLLVFEDDYDHEFHWSGRPVLPLASADPARLVVYVGTLSKVLSPGLRIGYVAARREIVERTIAIRAYVDRQGDHVVERAVAELIEDGELERHLKRARRAYRERRDVLADALTRELGDALSYELPPGGLALWARVRAKVSAERWAACALERGVFVHPGRNFAFDERGRAYFRLGFPALAPGEIRRAVRYLALGLGDALRLAR